MKPFSEACDRNKHAILDQLNVVWPDSQPRWVLEIGSGTGQHAVHFAKQMQHLTWITADLPERHLGIKAWLEEANLKNTLGPLSLDLRSIESFEVNKIGIYSA
jgi:tRNA G46 methylase TrmB